VTAHCSLITKELTAAYLAKADGQHRAPNTVAAQARPLREITGLYSLQQLSQRVARFVGDRHCSNAKEISELVEAIRQQIDKQGQKCVGGSLVNGGCCRTTLGCVASYGGGDISQMECLALLTR